jgi:hypothetical protein
MDLVFMDIFVVSVINPVAGVVPRSILNAEGDEHALPQPQQTVLLRDLIIRLAE